MNPMILVNGEVYPLDIGELDDTIAFKYLKKWSNLEFLLPFGRVMSLFQKGYIHELDEKVYPYFVFFPFFLKSSSYEYF